MVVPSEAQQQGSHLAVLSRKEILEYLDSGKLKIEPKPDPDTSIEQISIDLHLGRRFTIYKKKPSWIGALKVDSSLWEADLWEEKDQDQFILGPGNFVLAQTMERVTLPNDLAGLVEGRSSWARTGVSVHVTAPKIDPEFSAVIALEMTNLSPYDIILQAEKDKPCQLILFTLTSPIEPKDAYGTKKTHTFQGQESALPRQTSS